MPMSPGVEATCLGERLSGQLGQFVLSVLRLADISVLRQSLYRHRWGLWQLKYYLNEWTKNKVKVSHMTEREI